MGTWLISTLMQWGACLAVTLPFVLLGLWQAHKKLTPGSKAVRTLFNLAGFFLICLALVRLDNVVSLIRAPWQAMILEAVFALAVILASRAPARFGLTAKISPGSWRAALLATGLLLAYVVVRSLGLRLMGRGEGGGSPGGEYLLYLLTMPGIAEELVYRGVIQTRLNDIFGKPWKVAGAPLGWGLVATAVIFWAMHAFRAEGMALAFQWQTLSMSFVVGLVLGWIRERTGSLLPAMIAHNLVNVVWALI